MFTPVRQRRLLDHLRANGVCTVHELATLFGVTASTIRRDLTALDEQQLITRIHGGAQLADEMAEPQRMSRASVNRESKRQIGKAAAQLIPDGASVLITGGTTTEAVVPFLAARDLTVLTNSLTVANLLTSAPAVTVVVLGGVLRHEESSLLGPIPEQVLAEFNVDLAITGAYGFDPSVGTYGADVAEAGTDRQLLRACPSIMVVVDSSKIGRRGSVKIAPIDAISTLVTDAGITADATDLVRQQGIELVVAGAAAERLDDDSSTP
jgi:DeoR/GlpR family transcriptional regulator of sugar metabolism